MLWGIFLGGHSREPVVEPGEDGEWGQAAGTQISMYDLQLKITITMRHETRGARLGGEARVVECTIVSAIRFITWPHRFVGRRDCSLRLAVS